ncbi:P12 domain protein, putative [Rhizoctonia solani AG-3 Rhs1AP]|uniref:p12 domain protein, putative n=2 Tax=Rhizoctonia solani AG-3 TaxID=1086053 RepID=A0A0A1UJ46_9AGAM|nr:P12 domain protein, putative [Rhizoctonia solani AG-3 Rhs1AP]KEP51395.1 putative P12 domain protein [Rhizoctonia solani 123E]
MFTGALFWIATAAALPLGGETVCEIEEGSFSDDSRNIYTLIRRVVVERQDSSSSSSSGPALGVILGGVFGALGGLAIAGILFYAWWSVRRMRSKYGVSESGSESWSGPSSSTSRGSSSKSKKKRPKDGPKWQDPWLAPGPKSTRTPTAAQFHASASVDVAKAPGPQDDQGSELSAIPMKPIYPSDDK